MTTTASRRCETSVSGSGTLYRANFRMLHVNICGKDEFIPLSDAPFVAHHLKRLELVHVQLGDSSLDFSSCRELEELKMEGCLIEGKQILSESLRNLKIEGCYFYPNSTRISCPNLISLEITDCCLNTPLLLSMPSLVSAFIRLSDDCDDYRDYYGECGSSYFLCNHGSVGGNGSVLLNGLSDAIHLELINDAGVFIFSRDLRCCPTFNKLRILLLNEWCMAADSSALVYFLQYSLVLEKLNLQLRESPLTMVNSGGMDKNRKKKLLASKLL